MDALRLAIVGAGKHGARYAKHAAEDVEGIELVAVCRRDREKGRELADRFQCEYAPNAHELIARDDIDTIVFATVPAMLEELVPEAAARGKRIIVEKPIAIDTAAGARILSAIRRHNAYCMAAQTLRFNRVVRAIRDRIEDVGPWRSLAFSQRFPPQPALGWLDDPRLSGGGNILHTGVHCFDLITHLTGAVPTTVTCMARRTFTKRTEDNFAAVFGFADDPRIAVVTCSRTTEGRNGWIEVAGDDAQLVGDHVLHSLYRIDRRGRSDLPLEKPVPTVRALLEQTVADARLGAAPAIPYEEGLRAVAIAEACYASLASRRIEPIVLPQMHT